MALHGGHYLVCGVTRSGKGQFLRGVIERYRKAGVSVLFYTPKLVEFVEVEPMVSKATMDAHEFYLLLKKAAESGKHPNGIVAIIDEATVFFKQARNEMEEIVNQFAAYGVEVYVVVQRAKQVEPNIRNACDNIVCFRQRPDDAAYVADQYGDEFNRAASIGHSHFLARQGAFGELIEGRSYDDSNGKFERV